jgi:hypothetical protein
MMVSNENERGGLRKPDGSLKKGSFSGKCDVRLTAEENNILDSLANRNKVSRSDVMRKALRDFWKFNSEDEED